MQQIGKLYGVGVGAGAPDLMTLRAVRVINEAAVLAVPVSKPGGNSLAWRIAQPNLGDNPGQQILELVFPMTKDKAVLGPARGRAFRQVAGLLAEGKDVAFIVQGDPMLYSSFIYLFEAFNALNSAVEIEVVPGVSSLSAVPAVSGVPLADGQERIAVIPATYGVDDIAATLERFDSIVLMKVNAVIDEVIEALNRLNLLDKAVFIERAAMENQRIERDLMKIKGGSCAYFSMVVVNKKERSGVLAAVDLDPQVRRALGAGEGRS